MIKYNLVTNQSQIFFMFKKTINASKTADGNLLSAEYASF